MCFRFTPLAVFLFLFHRHIIERRECVRDCRRQCCCPCPAAYASAAPVLPDRVRGDCDGIIGRDTTILDSDKVSLTLRSASFRCSGDPVLPRGVRSAATEVDPQKWQPSVVEQNRCIKTFVKEKGSAAVVAPQLTLPATRGRMESESGG